MKAHNAQVTGCILLALAVCGSPVADGASAKLWAQDESGALAMEAEIRFAEKQQADG